jgi:hypothetical protein
VPRPFWRWALEHARERRLRPLERRAHVVVGDDPVALEDADGLVPRHTHRHALVDTGRDEVADGRAAQVVEDQRRLEPRVPLAVDDGPAGRVELRAREPRRDARGRPRLAEVADRGAPCRWKTYSDSTVSPVGALYCRCPF